MDSDFRMDITHIHANNLDDLLRTTYIKGADTALNFMFEILKDDIDEEGAKELKEEILKELAKSLRIERAKE